MRKVGLVAATVLIGGALVVLVLQLHVGAREPVAAANGDDDDLVGEVAATPSSPVLVKEALEPGRMSEDTRPSPPVHARAIGDAGRPGSGLTGLSGKSLRMNATELIEAEPGLARQIQAGVDESARMALTACVKDYRAHAGGSDRGGLQHTLVLSVAASNGEAVVVEAAGDEGWPEGFTASLQECLVSGLIGVRFPADRDFDYQIEYPIAIR